MPLRVYLNLDTLVDLRPNSLFPPAWLQPGASAARDARLRADGFEGVQVTAAPEGPADTTLPFCGLNRVNTPREAERLLAAHAARGDQCVTLHVGWGWEDDDEMDALVRAILDASQKHQLPAFIETHRATITQDMWRTVQLTKRLPDVRFNLDLSHYYCGQEMVYGDWEQKLAFLQPIFDRTGFVHGRIAAPGWMQAPIEAPDATPREAYGADYLAHFRTMWTRAMASFRRHAAPGTALIFAPELLRSGIYYARKTTTSEGGAVEETDRYAQALLYCQIARGCWAATDKTSQPASLQVALPV